MSVFREITIEFEGESYTFVPSNKLLRRIDAELHPQTMFGVLNQMDGQQAPLPALACMISMLLNEGGGEFTEDDVLRELYNDVRENNGDGIAPLLGAIAEALSLPSDVPAGNVGSPVKTGGKGKSSSKGKRNPKGKPKKDHQTE